MTSLQRRAEVGPTPTSANSGEAGGNAWLRPGEDTSGYSPERFYTRAHDHHGHGETIRGKIPPDLYAQIQVMVHDEALPDYRLPMDFVRDACVHHLHRRKDQLSSRVLVDNLLGALTALGLAEAIAASREQAERWHGMNEEITATMEILFRDGAYAQMAQNLDLYETFMADSSEPYRSKTRATIQAWRDKVPEQYLEPIE